MENLGGSSEALEGRWVILPRRLYEDLGDAIRVALQDTIQVDLGTAAHLRRLAEAWEVVEQEKK